MVLWMVSIALSVSVLVISAAVGVSVPAMAAVHLFVAALVALVMAFLAISDTRTKVEEGESQSAIAGSLMRYMGLISAWGALSVSITYGTGILEWAAWPQYFAVLMVLAGFSLYLSRILAEEVAAGTKDDNMLRISRYFACIILISSAIAVFTFGLSSVNGLWVVKDHTWAVSQVFFFGGMALAAVSAYMLKASVNEAH